MRLFPRTLDAVGSPLDLAVLRIFVPLVVLGTPEFRDMVEYSASNPALRVVPLGFQTILTLLPPAPFGVAIVKALLLVACAFSIVGFFARVSLAVAALLAFYGLGLAQIHGTVIHNHHLVWLLALLAASPCADVLSIDAWWKTRKGYPVISLFASPTRVHSAAILTAWLLITVVFFFPGFWKMRTSGLEWISSDNLRLQMAWKWYQTGEIPFFRIDQFPLLCQALSVVAVLFELSFGVLVFFRRTRPLAMLGLIGFHAFTHVFLHIRYPSLWICYVMFIDWRAVLLFVEDKPHTLTSHEVDWPVKKPSLLPVFIVGACLLGGNITFGVWGNRRGWPFACYPTFEWKPSPLIPRLYVELVYENDRVEELPLPRETSASRAQKQWGTSWSLAGVTDSVDETRLRALARDLENRSDLAGRFQGAKAIRFYRASYSVFPEAWGKPPVHKVLLAQWLMEKR